MALKGCRKFEIFITGSGMMMRITEVAWIMDINIVISACSLHTKRTLGCKILGYNSGVAEESDLLGCYVVPTGKQLRTFRIIVAPPFPWGSSSSRKASWTASISGWKRYYSSKRPWLFTSPRGVSWTDSTSGWKRYYSSKSPWLFTSPRGVSWTASISG